MTSSAFSDRSSRILVLFDVDGTLTPARQVCHPRCRDATSRSDWSSQGISPEMRNALKNLKKKVVVGVVGGSDLVKITEQLTTDGGPSESVSHY